MLRAVLLVAAVAAGIVMLNLFSSGVRWGSVAALAAIAVLTSPERQRAGSGWWDIYVVGLGITVLGGLLAGAAATLGGILALVGGALISVACAIGFPPGE